MPANTPPPTQTAANRLGEIGKRIRERRKQLGVSAVSAAEAAGMSRVTLHRIEKGEPSVSMGAYLNLLSALALDLMVVDPAEPKRHPSPDRHGWIPSRIRIDDYPQLRRLAWQVHGTDELSPAEALGIYERNWRHVDVEALQAQERDLIDALRRAFGGVGHV